MAAVAGEEAEKKEEEPFQIWCTSIWGAGREAFIVWRTMCDECRATRGKHESEWDGTQCILCFTIGVLGYEDEQSYRATPPSEEGMVQAREAHSQLTRGNPRRLMAIMYGYRLDREPVALAMTGTLDHTGKSPLTALFADQWMYDRRVWGRVMAFVDNHPWPFWAKYWKTQQQ